MPRYAPLLAAVSAVALLTAAPSLAATDAEIEALRAEVAAMRQAYESKIDTLEAKVAALEARGPAPAPYGSAAPDATAPLPFPQPRPATDRRRVLDNSFNPEIGVILQGSYKSFSEDESELAGFAAGHHSGRGQEGFSLDETELNFSASVDDMLRGAVTIGLHDDEHGTEVHVEEAYLETLALPYGLHAKFGRFLADLGYLNARHRHEDDFADRPLPYRAFLDGGYGDDGVQVSAILPTDFYAEVGAGAFAGDAFPGGEADGSDIGAWSLFGRVGGDLNEDLAWRLGLSTLQVGDDVGRHVHGHDGEPDVEFAGDMGLYIADARLTWAPTGNAVDKEVILQGEYFWRDEDGLYDVGDAGGVNYDEGSSGWYVQGIYKFHPQWRVGARYSQLYAPDVPTGLAGTPLDSDGHDPWSVAGMVDYSRSEFSRVRLQLAQEELSDGREDTQFTVQYIMSLGAHGAHPF